MLDLLFFLLLPHPSIHLSVLVLNNNYSFTTSFCSLGTLLFLFLACCLADGQESIPTHTVEPTSFTKFISSFVFAVIAYCLVLEYYQQQRG